MKKEFLIFKDDKTSKNGVEYSTYSVKTNKVKENGKALYLPVVFAKDINRPDASCKVACDEDMFKIIPLKRGEGENERTEDALYIKAYEVVEVLKSNKKVSDYFD